MRITETAKLVKLVMQAERRALTAQQADEIVESWHAILEPFDFAQCHQRLLVKLRDPDTQFVKPRDIVPRTNPNAWMEPKRPIWMEEYLEEEQ